MNDDVELRELRYFVAVAQELNFSRAAQRLGMAQSPLSKAIAQLETRLGVTLLARTTRQVTLTPAGETLLLQSEFVLSAMTAALARTRRAGENVPRLRVALKSGGDGALLRDIVDRYQRPELPAVTVTVATWGGPAALVRSGAADIAVLRSPFEHTGLEIEELLCEPRVVVLPAQHRLAARSRLRRADLAGEPLPHWPGADAATAQYWHGTDAASVAATWTDAAAAAPGSEGPVVNDLAQLLEVVALGQAVAFLPASSAARHARADIVGVPVTDLSPSIVAVAWPEGSRSAAVAAFVLAAVHVAESRPDALSLTDSGLPSLSG
ncbi:LysR family transcriptional regulator [Nocardia sp. NBC_01327]|uniref:LysR family transcriptional regulator n=1 Tax=Nocardia sp. NBC_01327 TaxID=2903593 RepID=UPI002E165BB0|nr:LysR family transcriptional regulator [Nocardia sp. NBC_01327]